MAEARMELQADTRPGVARGCCAPARRTSKPEPTPQRGWAGPRAARAGASWLALSVTVPRRFLLTGAKRDYLR